jgi:hypothetical protein
VEHAKGREWVEFLAPVPQTDGSTELLDTTNDVEDALTGELPTKTSAKV